MLSYIKLLRPHQWVKNLLIFFPLFFNHELFSLNKLIPTFFAFIGFSLIASSIYCLNDIVDVEKDRTHPKKKLRPIACGAVSIKSAVLLMLICFSFGLFVLLSFTNSFPVFLLGISYLLLNVAYSFILKNIVLIDVFIIAIGFVIRIFIGGEVGGVELSHWIVLMTMLLALFLGFAKRRDDVKIFSETGSLPRKNIERYSVELLNALLQITATITIVAYLMYTLSEEVIRRYNNKYLYLTSLFVIIGIFRYLQISMVDNKGGSPTKILLKDYFIIMSILCWVFSFMVIIYVL